MKNKRLFIALGILRALLFSTTVYAADYWTGAGARGMTLAVTEPKSIGLPPDQSLTTLVQGYFATTLGKYSAIDVQNRMNTEDILKQAELQNESSDQDIGKVLKVDYLLVGSINKTSSAFALNIEINQVQDNRAIARHSGAYTQEEIEDMTAVNKATLDLLGQMGVMLTTLARAELQQAASRQTIQGQTTLAQGIVAQRKGATVEAMTLYYQAAAVDPSLMEAANRVSIVSANIRTGNVGQNRRNDIQWRSDWRARLEETERYFDAYFKTSQPYALVYTPELQYGATNYRNETLPVSFTVELLEQSNWADPVLKTINNIWQALNATEQKAEWGFENWPQRGVSNVNPFKDGSKSLNIAVELVNDQRKVIARQTFYTRGSWDFSFNRDGSIQSFTSTVEDAKTITFPAVKASDLTEGLTLQFTTVNGVPVSDASKNGLLMITTRSSYRDAAGFDLSGYDQAGYDRAGYDRQGYGKNGFNKEGFNKEGYTIGGSFYDTTGYDKDGYDKKGYDRAGFSRSGYKRWSPISSYFEFLVYNTYSAWMGNDEDPGLTYKTTFGLLGAYFSADFDDEFIVGYTLNLLPGKKGRLWGLGVPFGVGRNNWENQLVLEAGLQLRFLLWEIRGTYRTIGFMDNSFILSAGWCIWKIDLEK